MSVTLANHSTAKTTESGHLRGPTTRQSEVKAEGGRGSGTRPKVGKPTSTEMLEIDLAQQRPHVSWFHHQLRQWPVAAGPERRHRVIWELSFPLPTGGTW